VYNGAVYVGSLDGTMYVLK
jgi:hypothetical protein